MPSPGTAFRFVRKVGACRDPLEHPYSRTISRRSVFFNLLLYHWEAAR